MSATVTITFTDDEIDRLDSLALVRDIRGSRRAEMVKQIVRYRLTHLSGRERELVDMLVRMRQQHAAKPPANVIPLRAVSR